MTDLSLGQETTTDQVEAAEATTARSRPALLAGAPCGRSGQRRLPAGRDTRRLLQLVLATIWLLDGALQFQPMFFTRSFGDQMIAAMAAGNPWIVAHPIVVSAHLIAEHAVLANTVFAIVQMLIGVGIAWPRTLRLALGASVAWALAVWWVGEGLGGILNGAANPLSGAPGAAILYAVAAVVLWPSTGSVAAAPFPAARAIGVRAADAIWIVLWGGFAFLAVSGPNRSPQGLHKILEGVAAGEPGWLAALNREAASLMAYRGFTVSIVMAAIFGLVALGIVLPAAWARLAVIVAVVLGVFAGVIAEDLGGLFTGGATDPNSGPLLVLLALAYWPPHALPAVRFATPPGTGELVAAGAG